MVEGSAVKVYPTVVANELQVSGVAAGEVYRIMSASGVTFQQKALNENGTISVSTLPNGYYVLRIAGGAYAFVKE